VALLNAALLPARAGSPEYLNYQGLLNGADGQPLPTGNYTLEFNIHDQANGDTKQWGPFLFDGGTGNGHGPLVPVANGRFNVIIGPSDTLSRPISTSFAGTNRFIEIKVNNGSPILPRQQFLSTPYAFKANTADQAAQATVAASVSDVNIAYRNTANTFTANQTVTGNITASGNITAGSKSVAVGEENLRIVRGTVAANGSTTVGFGFTATNNTTGVYTITFNPAFTGVPSVTANGMGVVNAVATFSAVTTASFKVTLYIPTIGVKSDPFSFIAIGPR